MLFGPALKTFWAQSLENQEMGDMVDQMQWEHGNMLAQYNKDYNIQVKVGVSSTAQLKVQ